MPKVFFPLRTKSDPKIYAYRDTSPQCEGLLKVGYTTRSVKERVREQYPTVRPGKLPYKIVFERSAMRRDGSVFTDLDVHQYLKSRGIKNPDGEWFECSVRQLEAAVIALSFDEFNKENRHLSFRMRPEQADAVNKTALYFRSFRGDNADKTPHFLWNAKMRFGKTFTAYKLAKEMGWTKILVLTFKPAVQSAWESDLKSHRDFKGWQFISPGGLTYEDADKKKPIVCFGSFQDYLSKNKSTRGIKTKN